MVTSQGQGESDQVCVGVSAIMKGCYYYLPKLKHSMFSSELFFITDLINYKIVISTKVRYCEGCKMYRCPFWAKE